ncbi:energy-coupling factor transporter transmembrane component T [Pseudalkalibacillus caeni]|uniref:Energy-coupling factor transporter transmembrane protein EcfT n=1 Tax=Exobacillus caeni TaxID=2574798 RepID=A0A5R9F0F9_9BACL|nr:energy-coupling factor transporter transmembrane component T [Pseudalkalibacillus caeni]TLS35916.1 energy-coupling factor transporter transmembrane protein EcfT [Pseudalkalibacillus caeni]
MTNAFNRLHPLTCFFYYAGAIVLLMSFLHPFYLIAAVLLLISLTLLQGLVEQLRNRAKSFFFLTLFIVAVNPLVNHRGTHILFYFRENPVTLEALMNGFLMALSLLAILILFISYNFVLTPGRFLYLFSKILPQTALLAMLTLRFVPLLIRRLDEIKIVQKSKGMTITEGRVKDRAKNGVSLVQILLTWSLEEALQTADSMKSRGYGVTKRSSYERYTFTKNDIISIVLLLVLFAGCLIGLFNGYGNLTLYPDLESTSMGGAEWSVFVLFLLYIGFPLLVEGREQFRWRYLN